MTFISRNPKIGDRVRLTQDVDVLAGTYTRGHEFTIVDYNYRGPQLEYDNGDGLGDLIPSVDGFPFEKV